MIFERHRIWTFFINLKKQGVIPKAKHEGKKITVDVINARFLDFGHQTLHTSIRMVVTPKGTVQTKHKFMEVDVIMETCYFTEGGHDDHGELFQGNKKHHQLIGENFHHNT